MTTLQIQKAELLNALHLPGTPLIVTNVWDAITATVVAQASGVRALATASHSVSNVRGLQDGEGLSVNEAIAAARLIVDAVDLPVSVDFEKGYAPDAAVGMSNWGAFGAPTESSRLMPTAPDSSIRRRTFRATPAASGA